MTTLFPDVAVEFSPTTEPLDPPAWVDITQHLRTFSIERGRSRELDRAEAGVATFLLDNHLGQFNPNNASSPYYPGIRPMRRVRIRSLMNPRWDEFTVGASFVGESDVLGGDFDAVDLFSGYVESWTQSWRPEPSPTPDATVTLQAVDAFKLFALTRGVPGNTGQSGPIAGMLIERAGFLPGDYTTEAGGYTIQTVEDSLANLLAALQDIDASEGGLFFVSRDGKPTFYISTHVAANPPTSSQLWGDATVERQYQSVDISTDDNTIANYVTVVSGAGGGYATDSVSQRRYFTRPVQLSTSLQVVAEMQTRALAYVAQYSVPRQQLTRLEVGVRDDVEWRDILSKDLLDRIVVRRRPNPGELIEQDSVIQGISISAESRWRWSVVWRLTGVAPVNLLRPDQASFDTSVAGWAAATNCTIALNASTPNYGAGCMLMTATGPGAMTAHVIPYTQLTVVPGLQYSAMASFYHQTLSRACHVDLVWLNSGGTPISTSTGTTATEAGAGVYVQSGLTAQAPANAAYVYLQVTVEGALAAEAHRVDTVGFTLGEQTGWSPGTGV